MFSSFMSSFITSTIAELDQRKRIETERQTAEAEAKKKLESDAKRTQEELARKQTEQALLEKQNGLDIELKNKEQERIIALYKRGILGCEKGILQDIEPIFKESPEIIKNFIAYHPSLVSPH